jgi:hypothetical protein
MVVVLPRVAPPSQLSKEALVVCQAQRTGGTLQQCTVGGEGTCPCSCLDDRLAFASFNGSLFVRLASWCRTLQLKGLIKGLIKVFTTL